LEADPANVTLVAAETALPAGRPFKFLAFSETVSYKAVNDDPRNCSPTPTAVVPSVTGSQGPVTAATAAAGGGNGQVWVNSSTHVYHKEGSRFYGKTKHGKYMSEQDAIKEGDHAAKNEH
jgi:hypothetical protein